MSEKLIYVRMPRGKWHIRPGWCIWSLCGITDQSVPYIPDGKDWTHESEGPQEPLCKTCAKSLLLRTVEDSNA